MASGEWCGSNAFLIRPAVCAEIWQNSRERFSLYFQQDNKSQIHDSSNICVNQFAEVLALI